MYKKFLVMYNIHIKKLEQMVEDMGSTDPGIVSHLRWNTLAATRPADGSFSFDYWVVGKPTC